jgi:hypothetical protein
LVHGEILRLWDEPAANISTGVNGLTITPTFYTGNYNIATAAPAANTQGWVGNAWGGGAYFEARFKFDGAAVIASKNRRALAGLQRKHRNRPDPRVDIELAPPRAANLVAPRRPEDGEFQRAETDSRVRSAATKAGTSEYGMAAWW